MGETKGHIFINTAKKAIIPPLRWVTLRSLEPIFENKSANLKVPSHC